MGKRGPAKGVRIGGRPRTIEDPVQFVILMEKADRAWVKRQSKEEGISASLFLRGLILERKAAVQPAEKI